MNMVDWSTLLEFAALLAVAYILALPVGWDQEREHGAAGIRVFPFLGLGSCAYILLAHQLPPEPTAEAYARVIQGLIAGIGFLSGGAILKDLSGNKARGIATAASMWVTSAVGAAVAFREFELAVLLSSAIFVTHKLMRPAKRLLGGHGPQGQEGADGDRQSAGARRGAADARRTPRESLNVGGDAHDPFWSGPHQRGEGSAGETAGAAREREAGTEPTASVVGVLVAQKDVKLKGLPHRVGLIRDDRAAEYLVDLGPSERLDGLELARGMYMVVEGAAGLVGNRQGLRASRLRFNGGAVDLGP